MLRKAKGGSCSPRNSVKKTTRGLEALRLNDSLLPEAPASPSPVPNDDESDDGGGGGHRHLEVDKTGVA